jgi:hypothetical protein
MARQWDVGWVSVSSTTELLSRLSRAPMARRAEQLKEDAALGRGYPERAFTSSTCPVWTLRAFGHR